MPERDNIPIAPGIKLENLIDFKGDCIDPLTLSIITESLDYALETSARRLKAAGKIYSELSSGSVLPVIKAIRNQLQLAPQCSPEGPRVVKPSPSLPPTPEKVETKGKTKVKATAAELKRIEEVVRAGGEGMTAEVLELIKDKPDLLAIVKAAVPEEVAKVEESKKKERSLPSTWGEVVKFKGSGKEEALSGDYDSPQVLANRLGIITRGATDMVKAFQRAGFKVTTNGDTRPRKGVTTGFVVERIEETPGKYRKAPIKPSEPIVSKPSKGSYIQVKGAGEQLIAYDFIDPSTDYIVPEKRIWVIDPDTGKPTGNKPPEIETGMTAAGPGKPTPEALFESTEIEEPTDEELAALEEEE